MSKKIESLTPEQIARQPEFVTRWTKIGLSTDRTNEADVRRVMADVYKAGGLKPVKDLRFVESPLAALKEARMCNKDATLSQAGYGAHDASWLSFYSYFREVCGLVEETEKLVPLMELATLCGWYFPFDKACVVSSRPTEIHLVNNRLHKDLGPAVLYADNFSVYALNGILMSEKHVMTPAQDISVQEVMKEQNVDIRRELLRKVGLERFISETNAKVIDTETMVYNNKTLEYKLLDIDLGDGVNARVLKMDNPSINAIHVEGVDETCTTVKSALAWRMGLDEYTAPVKLT